MAKMSIISSIVFGIFTLQDMILLFKIIKARSLDGLCKARAMTLLFNPFVLIYDLRKIAEVFLWKESFLVALSAVIGAYAIGALIAVEIIELSEVTKKKSKM